MKKTKLALSVIALAGLMWLTACNDDNNSNGSNSNNNTNNNNQVTNTPPSLANKSLTHNVNSGTGRFVDSGTYTLNLGGSDSSTSGEFTLFGVSGVADSSGTYTYTVTGKNTATLRLDDTQQNLIVTEDLTFLTATSGNYTKSIPDGSTQTGTFVTN